MEALTDNYLAGCRRYQGRIMRGENMTRIETFVDAAFAFAFTMLVISIDEIPQSPPELFALSRDIPAFLLSATLIGSVWLAHATWSRTFGLQDGVTIYLSLGLVMLVLIFVYPIKLMVQATVIYLSGGVLGTELFDNPGWQDNSVADLFLYFSIGLACLAILILAHYFNALRFRKPLRLNLTEIHFCHHKIAGWFMVVLVAVISCFIAAIANSQNIAWAGYVYFSLFFIIPLAELAYDRFWAHKLSLD